MRSACKHKSTTVDNDHGILVCTSCGEVIKEGVRQAEPPTNSNWVGYGRTYVRNPHNITYRYRYSRTPKVPTPKRRRGKQRNYP